MVRWLKLAAWVFALTAWGWFLTGGECGGHLHIPPPCEPDSTGVDTCDVDTTVVDTTDCGPPGPPCPGIPPGQDKKEK
jgi:hypothetical protein